MKLQFLLAALALACGAAHAQAEPSAESPPPPPAPPPQGPAAPLSAFEAIQPPPPLGAMPTDPATPSEPLRLKIDPNLTGPGVAAPDADAQPDVPEDRTED